MLEARMSILRLTRGLVLITVALAGIGQAQQPPRISQAIFGDPDPVTPEITTEQLQRILAEGRVPVLDTRSAQEYAIAHIPGSRNLYEKELDQVLAAYPDTAASLVLYCNGPYCGKSRRLSSELVKHGYTGVRRYQLGMPVWRALGNTVQTDIAGFRYIYKSDKTAVLVDARSPDAFRKGSLPSAVNIGPGEAEAANEDGRLPKGDKGTRVVVFADTPEQARAVATEVAHKAYWNSSYFGGTFRDLAAVARQ
jgi:rhodanese-related sulfurtransferase